MEIRPSEQNRFGSQPLQPAYAVTDAESALLRSVFGWMAIGLIISALAAYAVVTNTQGLAFLFNPGVFLVLMLVELGLVFFLSFRIYKMDASTAATVFVLYSAINGVTLAPILLMYTSASVASTFFVAAGTFGAMAFIGSVTKRDLSAFGSFLMMGLIGLILASLVSIFFHSSAMNFVINVLGVAIFVGLTVYDTNKIRRIGGSVTADSEDFKRVSIIGALALYLDFINLFIYLLRFLGDRRN